MQLDESQNPVKVQSAIILARESRTAAPHCHRELPVDCGEGRGRGQGGGAWNRPAPENRPGWEGEGLRKSRSEGKEPTDRGAEPEREESEGTDRLIDTGHNRRGRAKSGAKTEHDHRESEPQEAASEGAETDKKGTGSETDGAS